MSRAAYIAGIAATIAAVRSLTPKDGDRPVLTTTRIEIELGGRTMRSTRTRLHRPVERSAAEARPATNRRPARSIVETIRDWCLGNTDLAIIAGLAGAMLILLLALVQPVLLCLPLIAVAPAAIGLFIDHDLTRSARALDEQRPLNDDLRTAAVSHLRSIADFEESSKRAVRKRAEILGDLAKEFLDVVDENPSALRSQHRMATYYMPRAVELLAGLDRINSFLNERSRRQFEIALDEVETAFEEYVARAERETAPDPSIELRLLRDAMSEDLRAPLSKEGIHP